MPISATSVHTHTHTPTHTRAHRDSHGTYPPSSTPITHANYNKILSLAAYLN